MAKIAWFETEAQAWLEAEIKEGYVYFRPLADPPARYIENLNNMGDVPAAFEKIHNLSVTYQEIRSAYRSYRASLRHGRGEGKARWLSGNEVEETCEEQPVVPTHSNCRSSFNDFVSFTKNIKNPAEAFYYFLQTRDFIIFPDDKTGDMVCLPRNDTISWPGGDSHKMKDEPPNSIMFKSKEAADKVMGVFLGQTSLDNFYAFYQQEIEPNLRTDAECQEIVCNSIRRQEYACCYGDQPGMYLCVRKGVDIKNATLQAVLPHLETFMGEPPENTGPHIFENLGELMSELEKLLPIWELNARELDNILQSTSKELEQRQKDSGLGSNHKRLFEL